MAFTSRFRAKTTIDSPESLFQDLRNRTVQGLLSHQADMLRRYHKEALIKKDVAFELPTGSGKTLIGLLIGEYRRRVFGERVVYLCPTRQLVNQVVEQSRIKYGIKTNAFTGSTRNYNPTHKGEYNNAETIAVTTYSSLFNTNPFFHNPNLIILDDAHSSENYISSYWSLTIERKEYPSIYRKIAEVLKEMISPVYYQRLISEMPTASDLEWIDKVPSPNFIDIIPTLIPILDTFTNDTELEYAWSVIRDHLPACHLYLSYKSFLIRPIIPPSLTHAPFGGANQRIYMSATLGAGGELERITGISNINKLPIHEGWDKKGFGRRLFFFPEVSLKPDEALSLSINFTNHTPRALILVPDDKSVTHLNKLFTEKTKHQIFYAENLEGSKKTFTSTNNAVAVLANRLDGIDLLDDECRLLIIKGIPRATNLHEKFIQSRMAASILFFDRLRTRIVQAIGRCTRSATDYSAVVILGQELMDTLIQIENRRLYHPELQGEIEFGYEESKNKTVEEFVENLGIFLTHDENWDGVDGEIVARRDACVQEKLPGAEKLLATVKYEVEYQYAMWREDYDRAIACTEQVLQCLSGDEVQGYRSYWYYLSGSAAWLEYKRGQKQYAQVARVKYNHASKTANFITWLRSLTKLEIELPTAADDDIHLSYLVESLESRLSELGVSSNKNFELEVKRIDDGLRSSDAKLFESAHVRLGKLLGYSANNSESTGAPDPWWIVSDDLCIVFEDKSDGNIDTPVCVSKTRQAVSHPNWIKQNVNLANNAKIIPVMITTATNIDPAAVPHTGEVLYWHINNFRDWAERAMSIIRQLRTGFSTPGDPLWRAQAMQLYKDNLLDPLSMITALKSTPLAKLPVVKTKAK